MNRAGTLTGEGWEEGVGVQCEQKGNQYTEVPLGARQRHTHSYISCATIGWSWVLSGAVAVLLGPARMRPHCSGQR